MGCVCFGDIFCSFAVKVVVMRGFCVCRFRVWVLWLEVVVSLGFGPVGFWLAITCCFVDEVAGVLLLFVLLAVDLVILLTFLLGVLLLIWVGCLAMDCVFTVFVCWSVLIGVACIVSLGYFDYLDVFT